MSLWLNLQKEKVFKNKGLKRPAIKEAFIMSPNEDEGILDEAPEEALQQLDLFDKEKFGDEGDESD